MVIVGDATIGISHISDCWELTISTNHTSNCWSWAVSTDRISNFDVGLGTLVVKATTEEEVIVDGILMAPNYDVKKIRINKRYMDALPMFTPTRSITTPCSYVTKINPTSTVVKATTITIDSDCSHVDHQIVVFGLCL